MEQRNSSLLVGVGKSKRLDAIRKKTGLAKDSNVFSATQNNRQSESDLTQSAKEALKQARLVIEQRMSSILNTYPPGKTNTFFRLKYGVDVKKIYTLPLNTAFDTLKLDASKIQHFKMIENLDFNGVNVEP